MTDKKRPRRPPGASSTPGRLCPGKKKGIMKESQKEGRAVRIANTISDSIVDGPFVAARKSYAALFRGSDNQRLIDLRKTEREGRVVLWTRPGPLAHFTVPES